MNFLSYLFFAVVWSTAAFVAAVLFFVALLVGLCSRRPYRRSFR